MAEEAMIQFTLRLPRDIVLALRKRAEREDRSPSAEVRRMIRRHIIEADDLQKAA